MTGPVVVVGAGASGLAVSALLGRRGVPYVLLEQTATVGSAWRNRYDSLRLHTARRFSGLPGAPLPRDFGPWVARDDLVTYLEDYARRFDVRPVHGVQVHRLERGRGGWALQTSAGPRDARAVVLATGFTCRPHLPAWPGLESYVGDLRHAFAYRDPEPYRGRSVLVVGAGNSAAEIAVELTGVAARVELSVRTPPDIVRREVAGVPSQLLGIALGRLPAPVLGRLTAGLRRACTSWGWGWSCRACCGAADAKRVPSPGRCRPFHAPPGSPRDGEGPAPGEERALRRSRASGC